MAKPEIGSSMPQTLAPDAQGTVDVSPQRPQRRNLNHTSGKPTREYQSYLQPPHAYLKTLHLSDNLLGDGVLSAINMHCTCRPHPSSNFPKCDDNSYLTGQPWRL